MIRAIKNKCLLLVGWRLLHYSINRKNPIPTVEHFDIVSCGVIDLSSEVVLIVATRALECGVCAVSYDASSANEWMAVEDDLCVIGAGIVYGIRSRFLGPAVWAWSQG